MNDYLEHHGIKGQKWGIRRFQKKDGTRTVLGKRKQRQNTIKKSRGVITKRNGKETARFTMDLKRTSKRERRLMTEDELSYRIGRLEREKKLRDLELDVGRSTAHKVLAASGKAAATTLVTAGLIYGGKKTIKYALIMAGYDGDAVLKDMFPKKK